MMAVAHPKLGLRPFLPEDALVLREIFRDSIEDLTADDYTAAQQEAWASVADDAAEFGKKLGGQLTLIATLEGSPVGFASLEGQRHDRHALCTSGGGRAGRRRDVDRRAGKARRRPRCRES